MVAKTEFWVTPQDKDKMEDKMEPEVTENDLFESLES